MLKKAGYNLHLSFSTYATTAGPQICETKHFFFNVRLNPQHRFSTQKQKNPNTHINQSVLSYLYQTFNDRAQVIFSDILFFYFYSHEKKKKKKKCQQYLLLR